MIDQEFSPEMLQALMELGTVPDEMQDLLRQYDQAALLRNAEIPKGGMAGRVYVADPMGALAAGFDRVKGHNQMKDVEAQLAQLRKQQADTRGGYMNAVLGRGETNPNGVITYGVK